MAMPEAKVHQDQPESLENRDLMAKMLITELMELRVLRAHRVNTPLVHRENLATRDLLGILEQLEILVIMVLM